MKPLFVAMISSAALLAQPGYTPSPENLQARNWFQDAQFGIFIHWGVYSVLGDGEWALNNQKLTLSEYEKLAPRFNPTAFDAAEWVSLFKQAGAKYVTVTSKHHDGFAMWDTKQNAWSITGATPYKKDPLKMLAEECQKQGLKLFFYHSQLDWHHPDYFPLGRTGHNTGRPSSGDFNRYLDFMDAQLRELLTGYGPVGGIWFDGWWDKPTADWRLNQTYAMIHRLQPAALIGSNHHKKPFEGEDFQMFEKDLPGQNTAGFSGEAEVSRLPLETCDTINRSWGYNAKDKRFKSTKELVHYLARAAGFGANFLLNIGPMPDGRIQPEFVERLKEVGEWLGRNGKAIYATREGPVPPRPWGVTTQTKSQVYVHVLEWNDRLLAVPPLGKVRNARLLSGGAVKMTEADGGVLFHLPAEGRDPIDTIIVLDKVQ